MNNFKGGGPRRGGQKFGGKNYGDNKRFGAEQRKEGRQTGAPTKQFSATCSECTKKCDVPFKPSPDKPIYCSACFGMKKSANESRGSYDGSNRSDRNGRTDQTKLPRDQRSPRHDPTRGRGDDGIADLKRQISGLEQKLNKILDLINPPAPSQKVPTPIEKEVDIEDAPKKITKKVVKEVIKKVVKKVVKKAVVKKAPVKKVVKEATKVASKKKVVSKAKK